MGFIEAILPELRDIDPPVRVLVVGGEPTVPEGLQCEVRPWTPENEAWALAESAIGLYPIDAGHPLAEGKCGLKAVLFMSAGVPVLVTPTTTNAAIVRDGVEGFHVDDGGWAAAASKLLADEELLQTMRARAHRRALADFSLATWAPALLERLTASVPA